MSKKTRREVYRDEGASTAGERPISSTSILIDIEEAQEQRRKKRKEELEKTRRIEKQKHKERRREEKNAERKLGGVKRVVFVITLVCALAVVVLSGRDIANLKDRELAAQEEAAMYREQRDGLVSELAAMESPEYIESQARERLRMIKPGEILYILEDGAVATES